MEGTSHHGYNVSPQDDRGCLVNTSMMGLICTLYSGGNSKIVVQSEVAAGSVLVMRAMNIMCLILSFAHAGSKSSQMLLLGELPPQCFN